MINLQGKRNSAVIYADKIDKPTKTQIASILREEAYADNKIRIMPDTHSGKYGPVGTTMTLGNRLCPALLGVDIGCGMEAVVLNDKTADLEKLDDFIHKNIPCGAKIHLTPKASFDFSRLLCAENVDKERALLSLGSLGGGNHFIELDKAEDGTLVLVIHSGSRQLGSDTAMYYLDQAYRYQCKKARKRTKQRRSDDDFGGFKSFKSYGDGKVQLPKKEESILEGPLFEEYLQDISVVTEFAELNRRTIAELICDSMGFSVKERFSCVHNYIDTEHGILRKGAISARQGERVIIPLNMRDGAILGTGRGNPEWNFSAPHGAGRACSRSDARAAYTLEEFQKQMEGIYTTTAQIGSVEECPMAYKAPERILQFLGDTVSVEQIIKPVYNFKDC